MRRIRFDTIADVYEAFPALSELAATVVPTEEAPVPFLERLARAGEFDDALTLCPFVLPRREAVWWACRCVLLGRPAMPAAHRHAWEVAAAWVHRPDERRRQSAYDIGMRADRGLATTWLCRAAVWSGGAMEDNEYAQVPAPADLSAKAARAAVLFAAAERSNAERAAFLGACIEIAMSVARGEGDLAEEVLQVVRG